MGEELDLSAVRLREPRGVDGLARELARPMGERLESALGLDDFANQTVGVLADR